MGGARVSGLATTPEYAAQRLYALATALYHLEAETRAEGPVDPLALGAAVDAALVEAARCEAHLRDLAAQYPAAHDDLARLAAAIRGGTLYPDAAARAAGWVAALDA